MPTCLKVIVSLFCDFVSVYGKATCRQQKLVGQMGPTKDFLEQQQQNKLIGEKRTKRKMAPVGRI